MYIPQPVFHYGMSLIFQHLCFVAVAFHYPYDHIKMYRQHVGYKYGIVPFHLLCKFDIIFVYFCHLISSAPKRLRRRILTAPRFVISSIFICV